MKRGKKIMIWTLAVVALISGILIWFYIPYSPTRAEFARLTGYQMTKTTNQGGVFTSADIAELPLPVQKHFQYCGYMGKSKMSNMNIHFNDVDFVLSPDKPKLKIKYIQYNFAEQPDRIAYIDTSLYGIPFEGIDAYRNGAGSMKGVIAKAFTLFDQKGAAMDQASLVTCLAESLFLPTLALQDYIRWEKIDETHAGAVINYYGTSAGGIFTFDDNGAMTSFTTNDREHTDTKGNSQKVKWSAVCGDYEEVDGIKFPSNLKGVWHFETGDLVYFDGRDISVKYDVSK
ncbi:MAG: hypothetical protein PHD36_03600 [Desulfotomaculaceae bacterium]|nr:hypothetical protein [Desulfotomaculaceae bacterium]